MGVTEVISLLCGVALFLFGMSLMGEGLKRVSGSKLEPILFRLSNTTLKGVLLGTGVTAVIQSSCATSVMVVGFVNARMMKLRQAIGVILGAILGTSITGWVICLSYIENSGGLSSILSTATLTGVVAVAGILLRMVGKNPTTHHVGDICMGFAVLMVGMSTMSGAVSGLGKQAWFLNLMSSMKNPLLGILVGALFTAILQSASAAVGIVQALSVTGVMTLAESMPLLMGVCIGAAAPVMLSAIGASVEGRRTAYIYLVASVIGVTAFAAIFHIGDAIFHYPFMNKVMNPFSIAGVNSVLRLAMLLILLPFTDVLEAIVSFLVREKTDGEPDPSLRLEERFIHHPALAIEQSRTTINEMAEKARTGLDLALDLLFNYNETNRARVEQLEAQVDRYEDVLGSYLVQLTGQELSDLQNQTVTKYLHTLSDLERISDHALNIAENADEIHEKGLRFSDAAHKELDVLIAAVKNVVQLAIDSFLSGDLDQARHVEPLEEVIDNLCDAMKLHHVERLQKGICTIQQGFVFNDFVTNCERVSDHCSNVALAMLELNAGNPGAHELLNRIRERHAGDYDRYLETYTVKYEI